MKRALRTACLGAALWITFSAGPASAQDRQGANAAEVIGPNVRITMTLVDSDPGVRPEEQSYQYVARDGGGMATLLMGWRVPIPTTRAAEDAKPDPVTEYTYQNIGFTANLWVSVLEGGRILLRGEVEASGARKGPAGISEVAEANHLPIIGTFQQQLNVVLEEGKPLRVAEVPDPEGGRLHLEIRADVLD